MKKPTKKMITTWCLALGLFFACAMISASAAGLKPSGAARPSQVQVYIAFNASDPWQGQTTCLNSSFGQIITIGVSGQTQAECLSNANAVCASAGVPSASASCSCAGSSCGLAGGLIRSSSLGTGFNGGGGPIGGLLNQFGQSNLLGQDMGLPSFIAHPSDLSGEWVSEVNQAFDFWLKASLKEYQDCLSGPKRPAACGEDLGRAGRWQGFWNGLDDALVRVLPGAGKVGEASLIGSYEGAASLRTDGAFERQYLLDTAAAVGAGSR